MSARLSEIVSYLDDLLRVGEFKDFTVNGLQVEGQAEVTRVGFAVDACLQSFEALAGCQLIVVHHGLWWPSTDRLVGAEARRIRALFEGGTSLYASHLPLDRHPQIGNNACLLRRLGMEPEEAFGEVGWLGTLSAPLEREAFIARVVGLLGSGVRALSFGVEQIARVAVCSGSGSPRDLRRAEALGADLYLTGEASHPIHHAAREAGMNVLLGGNYATETWGLQALRPLLEEAFGVETRFVDLPTGF